MGTSPTSLMIASHFALTFAKKTAGNLALFHCKMSDGNLAIMYR
jgi:hypothetical protein